jgi:NAD(P)-dependent dehydrogenase (short-subunit alcohol dehydrogenase family)
VNKERLNDYPRPVGRTWLAEDSSQCHCARLYSERGHSGGGASWRGKRQALYLCYSAWPIRRTWGFAAVAVFLSSDASSWITGETIRVGGGAR